MSETGMDLRIDEKYTMQSFKKQSNIWYGNGQLQNNEQNHITVINQANRFLKYTKMLTVVCFL